MKKVLFAAVAVLSIVSCQKDQNFDSSDIKSTSERQAVVLGGNMTRISTTKASVNDIHSWYQDGKKVYVYGINNNPDSTTVESKLFINNIAASVNDDATLGQLKGSLDLKNPTTGKSFYYGQAEKDIYSFYAYYLGYDLTTETPYYNVQTDSLSLADVKVNGDNDIMIASTDKTNDAIVDSIMVNPKYNYSEYSARHGVVPNLVFNHQLSKFVFNVKYGSTFDASNNEITLDSLMMDSQTKGTLVIAGSSNVGFIPEGDKSDVKLSLSSPFVVSDTSTQVGESLMLVPADTSSYTLKVFFTQKLDTTSTPWSKVIALSKTIKPSDIKLGGVPATAFEAGKMYEVNITVYGLEAIKVNVELRDWENAGSVEVDPDQRQDGILDGIVVKTVKDGTSDVVYLQMKQGVAVGKPVIDAITEQAAAEGTYTLTPATLVGTKTINNITVDASGNISAINS